MNESVAACEPNKWGWLQWDRFPIVPMTRYRPRDEYNCSSFYFHWLVFRAWTIMSPDISVDLSLDDMGFQARVRLPYLITGVFVPLFPWRWHQKLWRTGTRSYK